MATETGPDPAWIDVVKSVTRQNIFTAIDTGNLSSLVIPVRSPYAIVEAALDLDVKSAGPHSAVTVTCQPADDAYNRGIRSQSQTVEIKPGVASIVFDIGARKDVSGGVFGYNFIIQIGDGNAPFFVRRVKTTFMLNMYSLPYFAPEEIASPSRRRRRAS